jgi:hypothetical protein
MDAAPGPIPQGRGAIHSWSDVIWSTWFEIQIVDRPHLTAEGAEKRGGRGVDENDIGEVILGCMIGERPLNSALRRVLGG